MQPVKLADGRLLALVSWHCKAWFLTWEQVGDKIVNPNKVSFNNFLSDLDEEDQAKLNGMPFNATYDERFKEAFSLY